MRRLVPNRGLRATALASGAVILSYEVEPASRETDTSCFSPAEREVICLMLLGRSDAEIAIERGCSRHTVSNLLRSAYRRIGVTSRVELAAWLKDQGVPDVCG